MHLRDDISLGDYICLLVESLEQDEVERYYWWVNSQQDPKKFKWQMSKEKTQSPIQSLIELAKKKFKGGIKGNAYEYANATGKEIVYMEFQDGIRKFFDKDNNLIPDFDPKSKRDRDKVVVRR